LFPQAISATCAEACGLSAELDPADLFHCGESTGMDHAGIFNSLQKL
jgi:hypothetical protein